MQQKGHLVFKKCGFDAGGPLIAPSEIKFSEIRMPKKPSGGTCFAEFEQIHETQKSHIEVFTILTLVKLTKMS